MPSGRLDQVKTIQSYGEFRFNNAKGIALDKAGNIYVADGRSDRVLVFTPNGRLRFALGGKADRSPEKIKNPTSVAVHDDRVFVGSYGTGKILVYNNKGKLLDVLPRQDDRLNLAAIYPLAMTSDGKGNIYVSDGKQQKIAVFDTGGKLRLIFGGPGYEEGQLRHVNGLAVDEPGRRLIVMDSGNLRVQFFNLDGKFLQQVTYQEKAGHIMVAPRGLAYEPESGTIYIAEAVLDKVFAVDEKGKIIARSPDIGLSYPHGLAIGPDGYLYVGNREAGQISVLNP